MMELRRESSTHLPTSLWPSFHAASDVMKVQTLKRHRSHHIPPGFPAAGGGPGFSASRLWAERSTNGQLFWPPSVILLLPPSHPRLSSSVPLPDSSCFTAEAVQSLPMVRALSASTFQEAAVLSGLHFPVPLHLHRTM